MDYSTQKIHRIKFTKENIHIALPKKWDLGKKGGSFTFVLILPQIRPDSWHFTIQFEYKPEKECTSLHCHWTNQEEKKRREEKGELYERETILEIYLSTKKVAGLLPQKDWETTFQKSWQVLGQSVVASFRRGASVFQLMSKRDNFFLYYGANLFSPEKVFQNHLDFFPYETSKKQLVIPGKLTASIKKKLNVNLLKPIENPTLKPGFYIGFLLHPQNSNALDVGYLIMGETNEPSQNYFLLKHQIHIITSTLLKSIYEPLCEITESLITSDRIIVKWKGKKIPSIQVKKYIDEYFTALKRSQVEQIISAGLEAYFWRKGYRYKFNPQFEWASPFAVAYKGNKRVIVALAWIQAEIPKMVDSLFLFRSKYKAKNSIFITPDKKIAHECLRKHKLEKNILLLLLEPQIFINMFDKVIH